LFLCGALCWCTTASAQDKLPKPDESVQVDKYPEPITRVDPVYPDLARKAGIEGKVIVKLLVDVHGKVIDSMVMNFEGPNASAGLQESALAAAKQWTFKPAEADGKPVAVWVVLPFQFKLSGPKVYSAGQRAIIDRYMQAYNHQDAKALAEVVEANAAYLGSDSKSARNLLEQHREAWKDPSSLGAKMTWGKLDGKDVVVVWTKLLRTDGKLGDWQKGSYLIPDISGEKITRVSGTVVLTHPAAAATIVATPPQE